MSESRLNRSLWTSGKALRRPGLHPIIETGLDISNANTLIVDGADKYGLSAAPAPRVGRGQANMDAYFLYPSEKPLGEVALERLKAVATHNELGAGIGWP